MSQAGNPTGMPLVIWVRTFFICIALLAATNFLLSIRDQLIGLPGVGEPLVEEHSNARENRLDAYFLGSSLTNHALVYYHSLDSTLSGRKNKFYYKTVISNAVSLEDFDNRIREIRELRPKYLFIESYIVCIDMHRSFFNQIVDRFSGFRARLARIPEYFFNMGSHAFKLISTFAPRKQVDQNNLKMDFNKLNTEIDYSIGEKFSVRKINDFKRWDSFYKEAANLGIKICLLEIPRSGEAEQHLPVKLRQRYQDLVKEYQKEYNIQYIDFPYSLGRSNYYIDRAHFNKQGSFLYCKWLMTEICKKDFIKCD